MSAAGDDGRTGGGAVGPRLPGSSPRMTKAGGEGEAYGATVSAARAATAQWQRQAHDGQTPPEGDWATWVFLGGRGAGKTRAGAEWVWGEAMRLGALVGSAGRIALVGPTLHDVRSVMLEGPSGLLRLSHWSGARFEASKRRVTFPGGCVGVVMTADEPERFRGPQFHAAWGDEFCAWGRAEEALAMLRLGLRLRAGDGAPRLLLTTTPKPVKALRDVLKEAGTVLTHAPTRANAANLAGGFLDGMEALYGGTRRAAQELEGVVLEPDGALFTRAELDRARAVGVGCPGRFEAVVVAVDPPAGTLSGEGGDACGIVVAGRAGGVCWVLADRSVRGLSPHGWAGRVRAAAEAFGAGRIVVEANQGGAMVEALIAQEATAPVRRVHARWGKAVRAEPVAALYEQGRVGHVGAWPELEEELMTLGVEGAADGSPDRADALVWAVTELMLTGVGAPRVRGF